MSKIEYKDLIAFHPAYYIKEIIEDMEMSQDEFAKRLNISGKTVSQLINGKINLSNDIASRLATLSGTNIELWLNLQKSYDLKVLEIKEKQEFDNEISLLKLIDYNYFVNLGVVENTKDAFEKVKNLCAFFKISTLSVLLNRNFIVNYRSSSNFSDKNIINSKAWLQTAINLGKCLDVKPFNKSKLIEYIPEIREMSTQTPEVFLPRIEAIFSECGVRFVVLPHLKNSGINGAVTWINSEKVILAMNDKNKYADMFWFSIFHEIKHVLQQKYKMTLISYDSKKMEEVDKHLENEANEFAQETLIPNDEYKKFVSKRIFNEGSIDEFAKYIRIHSGIVVGRLQKDGYIPYHKFNYLREQYNIKTQINPF